MIFIFAPCLFISFASLAQGPSIIDEIMFRIGLENSMRADKKASDSDKDCHEIYLRQKKNWFQVKNEKDKVLLYEGNMARAFTRFEIESMGEANYHGLKAKIRGTDVYTTGGYSVGRASFPHVYPGCESIFKEEVKILEISGIKCREIKFTQNNRAENVYFQVYCENSKKIGISFEATDTLNIDEIVTPKDCISCSKN